MSINTPFVHNNLLAHALHLYCISRAEVTNPIDVILININSITALSLLLLCCVIASNNGTVNV